MMKDAAMDHLDRQMQKWCTRLRDDLKITPPESNSLATTIAMEVSQLPSDARQRIKDTSQILLRDRLDELVAFQGWMDYVDFMPKHRSLTRAQIVTQIYVCFVYLGEGCFKVLQKELASGSAARKCSKFLTDNPVRAFRNAIAHANWKYLSDYSGLEYWARKDSDPSGPLSRFEVSQNDLSFWQALARCTAYASFLSL
jgi:hypothetical protein